jgi:hypothetical protein
MESMNKYLNSTDLAKETRMTDDEKALLVSFGPLTYPILLINSDNKKQYIFSHDDSYFEPKGNSQECVSQLRNDLPFNETHHIRCKMIQVGEKEVFIKTEWNDFAAFLGTNKKLNEPISKDQTIRDFLKISAMDTFTPYQLANELAVIGSLLIQDQGEIFLMLTKRSESLKVYPNCMSTAVSGAMGATEKWTDFINNNGVMVPDPIETILRETK